MIIALLFILSFSCKPYAGLIGRDMADAAIMLILQAKDLRNSMNSLESIRYFMALDNIFGTHCRKKSRKMQKRNAYRFRGELKLLG
jgi:hypothetical protein